MANDLDETLDSILTGKPPKEGPRLPADRPKPEGGGTADDKELDETLDGILAGSPSTAGPSAPKAPTPPKPTTLQATLHGPVSGVANLVAAPGGMMQAIGQGLEAPAPEQLRGHVPDWLLDTTAPIRNTQNAIARGMQWLGDKIGPQRVMDVARNPKPVIDFVAGGLGLPPGLVPDPGPLVPEDPNWEPETGAGRFANLLTQNLTSAAAGAPLARAAAGRMAVGPAPAPPSPGASTGALMAPAVGAAGLQHAAHEIAPGNPILEMGAGILGGHGGVGLANATAKATSPLRQMSDAAKLRAAKSRVFRDLATEVGNTTPSELADAFAKRQMAPMEDIPGYSPSTGRLLGDNALLAIEKALEARGDPTPGVLAQAKRHDIAVPPPRADVNQQAIRGFGEQEMPGDPNLPRRVSEDFAVRQAAAAEAEAKRLRDQAAAESTAAGEQADAASTGLPASDIASANTRKVWQGENFTANVKTIYERNKMEAGERFAAIDPNGELTVHPRFLRDAYDGVRQTAFDRGKTDEVPTMIQMRDPSGKVVFKNIEDFFKRQQLGDEVGTTWMPNMTFEQARGLRSSLTDAIRDSKNRTEKAYIGQLIDGLDKSIEASIPADRVQAYQDARTFFRDKVAKPFYDDTSIATGINNDSTPPSVALKQYVQSGPQGHEGAQQLIDLVGHKEANQIVRDHTINDIVSYAMGPDGRLDARKLNDWINLRAANLQWFPEVRQQVQDRAALVRAAEDRIKAAASSSKEAEALAKGTIKRSQDDISKSSARFFLDNDPQHAIKGILGSSDPTTNAKNTVVWLRQQGGPEAVSGLARTYYDDVMRRVMDPNQEKGVRGAALHKIMRDEAGTMRELLPADVIKRLRTVADALSVEGRTAPARQTFLHALLDDHKVQTTGPSPAGTVAMGVGALAGHSVAPGVGTIAGGSAGRSGWNLFRRIKEERSQSAADLREAILRDIVFNPNSYREGMSTYEPERRTPYIERHVAAPFLLGLNAAIINKTLQQAPRDEAGDSTSITGLPVISVDKPGRQ